MSAFDAALPVDEVLPALRAALAAQNNVVLVAPPGAGKTTRVPLALAAETWAENRKLILLEPRRLAARAAAERMAATLGERVGETVGLRMRLETRVSARTRIEVLTEGVFARIVLEDPGLEGVAAVLFDEFHERSLDADIGLALALDVQTGLRDDLRLLVMSATLDGARVATLLGAAPIIESTGRAFPVETIYAGRDPRERIEDAVTKAIRRALATEEGSILAFLPGQAEITRVAQRLSDQVEDPAVEIAPLYGALDAAAQKRAIAPCVGGRRKIVLATSIAETSLTIEGVRIVVDSGLARVPCYEPDTGLTRLETRRVSRASADQRRGRAGRTEPGTCFRLWEAAGNGALAAFSTPDILAADLSGLVLDLAAWGVREPATQLRWLDPPPASALAEARSLLRAIGALDAADAITEGGRAIRKIALPPRLAAMVSRAAASGDGRAAAELAVLLLERGLGGTHVDLAERLSGFRRDQGARAEAGRRLAANFLKQAGGAARGQGSDAALGSLLALAFPDRIAKARGALGQFLLANGRAAALEPHDPLARAPYLAVGEMTGSAAAARIVSAAALDLDAIETVAAETIEIVEETSFDIRRAALSARRQKRLGALVLVEQNLGIDTDPQAAQILAEGIARLGLDRLPWTKPLLQTRDRVAFLRRAGEADEWPDLSDAALTQDVAGWLAPFLVGKKSLAEIAPADLGAALDTLIPWDKRRQLDAEAPTHFVTPAGSSIALDYGGDEDPVLAVRVQELYGLATHPALARGRVPLLLELLSPAGRPIQITGDLPKFWRGSWAEVRAEMKGRYPKHLWPDDPAGARPTNRAKPRTLSNS